VGASREVSIISEGRSLGAIKIPGFRGSTYMAIKLGDEKMSKGSSIVFGGVPKMVRGRMWLNIFIYPEFLRFPT